jgi:chorismate mutase
MQGTFKIREHLKGKKTFLVAGPCSVESEEQIMQTARELAEYPVNVIRGGIWKPRTRPGLFEGVGVDGLKWLKDAGSAINIPVTVEVAMPEHIEEALKHGIDILWIGARTTTNPFSMQILAEALQGVDIPVMVKNPMSPDIDLWIGAFERLYNCGVSKLIAVHRGFSSHKKTVYRNAPNWRIPIEFRRTMKSIPLLCDPSHICGNTTLLQSIAQEAMDLLFDGLMIEVHVDPKEALSDAKQQITPSEYGTLIEKLRVKKPYTDDEDFFKLISEIRKEIDDVDSKIIDLMANRMNLSRQIGTFKKGADVSHFQPDRWNEIVKSRTKAGAEKNLSEDFIYRIYQYIHEESIRQQEGMPE